MGVEDHIEQDVEGTSTEDEESTNEDSDTEDVKMHEGGSSTRDVDDRVTHDTLVDGIIESHEGDDGKEDNDALEKFAQPGDSEESAPGVARAVVVEDGTGQVLPQSSSPAIADGEENFTALVGDPNDPLDFDKLNSSLLGAHLAKMDRELDGMDWNI